VSAQVAASSGPLGSQHSLFTPILQKLVDLSSAVDFSLHIFLMFIFLEVSKVEETVSNQLY
jgi:hypothetical protein